MLQRSPAWLGMEERWILMPDEPHIAPGDGEDAASPTPDSADHGDETRHATLPSRPRRPPSAILGGFAAVVVVVLLALLLTTFAPGQIGKAGTKATGTPTATTNGDPTSTATAIATATASLTPTPTTTIRGTPSSGSGDGGPPSTSLVTATGVDAAPIAWEANCSSKMTFHFSGGIATSVGFSGGPVTYRWIHSDGSATSPETIMVPAHTGDTTTLITSAWDVSAITGTGQTQWGAVEILAPNHFVSAHANIELTCDYEVYTTSASVQPGSSGGNPPEYNCSLGGDQTFTFSGVINVSPAPGSHSVTYHWARSDGTVGSDQAVTIPPGAQTADVQPDSWTIHQSDTDSGSPRWEEIVVTSSPGVTAYQAQFFKFC